MDRQRRLLIAAAAFSLPFGAMTLRASAQTWPNRSVKLVVPRAAGSGADIAARILAEQLAHLWEQAVVVENKPGGDAAVAINTLLSAQDDHTLLYTPASSITAHIFQHEKPAYDIDALMPVAKVSTTTIGFIVAPSLGVSSLADFMGYVRANPGKLNFSTGTGLTDLIVEGYFRSAGLNITRIPYRDVTAPITDLGEGRIHAYVAGLAAMIPAIESGRAKLVAITNTARVASQPSIPTVREAGFPALTFDGLVGVFAQRDMAPAVRDRIAADVRKALAVPALAERFNKLGVAISPGDAAEFSAALKEQGATLAAIAAATGMTPN